MNTTTWDSYAIQSADIGQQTQQKKTLIGLEKTEFGEKATYGLILLILATILELSVMIFPLSTDMTDLDSMIRTMKLAQGFGFVVAFFKLIGLILIATDLKNFIIEINKNRNQYNDNLSTLARKINQK